MGSFHRRRAAILRYFGRLREASELGIGPHDLVLDLGSGQDPHPRANVLCDKYVADATERACGAGLVIDRPLVLADATATPFPDKSFDFVFCSHLLEHMDDPGALLTELMRIGRRGYIETPSKTYEKLYGWDFHHWFVSVEDDVLILERKESAFFDEDLHSWFGRRMEEPAFESLVIGHLNDFGLLTTFVWKGDIAHEIRDPGGSTSGVTGASVMTIAEIDHRMTAGQKIKTSLGRRLRRKSDAKVANLLNSLQCPVCGSLLELGTPGRTCSRCALLYPIADEVHVALAELASSTS